MMHDTSADFGSFWAPMCDVTRGHLEEYDQAKIGRVRLTQFHELSEDHDHSHFHESKSYLRDLGALDNSSARVGPQVVIPNYVESPANCIVTNRQYSVCCRGLCDSILSRLEQRIRAPVVEAETVLSHI